MGGSHRAGGWRCLPNSALAWVPAAKLDYYLDDARRHAPNSKVGLFRDVLGFADRQSLSAALVRHAQAHPAVEYAMTSWGVLWNVDGLLEGPTRAIQMRTAWMIDHDSRRPRNTTAYPLARGGR